MKKRIISLCLIITVIVQIHVPVFADDILNESENAEESFISITEQKIGSLGSDTEIYIDSARTIVDFDENEYVVVECLPKGYFIYHVDSGICVEYNLYAQSPFTGLGSDAVYGGPSYYYAKEGDTYVHTVLETVIEGEAVSDLAVQCEDWNDELIACAGSAGGNTEVSVASSSGTDYWVSGNSYFTSAKSGFGYVSGGYCGYIAANLILKYWDYMGTISLPVYGTTGLTNTLIGIGEDEDYDNSTWAKIISSIINTYCAQNSLPQKASWAVGAIGVVSEINNDRPVILFGNLSNYSAGNHAVVVYGYNTYENSGYYTFRCHFGWNRDSDGNTYEDVHVCGATGSIFGSNTKYKPDA